jgi:hypothetical protein
MRGARAGGALFSLLIFLLGAGVAHADPSFVLAESGARAGDPVHFSISGAEGRVEYEVEVGGRDVAAGSGAGTVSGQFTMPNLGNSAKAVTVEADLEDEDDDTTVYRKLQYLGPVVAVTGATGVQPAAAPAPAAPEAPASAPQPVHVPQATAAPAAVPAAARQRSKRRAKHRRKRAKSERRRHAPGSGGSKSRDRRSRGRDSAVKHTRTKRLAPRTAPLFDGVPEPGSPRRPESDADRAAGPKETTPRTAKLAGARVDPAGQSAAAVLIPALLAFASLVLAGTALLRKRRLASEGDRTADTNRPRG